MRGITERQQKTSSLHQVDAESRKLVEVTIEIQSKLFDKTAAYNNIVTSLGFAGFLAIWVWARDLINPWDAQVLAFMLGLSLFFFVLWNVITMFMISRRSISLAKIMSKRHLTPQDKLKEIEQFERYRQRWLLGYYASWYIVFVLTAVFGFFAGALLIALTGLTVLNIDFGIYSIADMLGYSPE